MSDGSVEDAWYSTEELIIWTRVLLDRLRGAAEGYFMPRRTMSPKITTTATITIKMITPVPWETSRFLGRVRLILED
jgi:hypothetical protein